MRRGGTVVLLAACLACSAACKRHTHSSSAKLIASLPYATVHRTAPQDRGKRGVTVRKPAEMAPGLTVYCSLKTDWVLFVDDAGHVLHRIHTGPCNAVAPDPDGGILVVEYGALAHIGWDSKVFWRIKGPFNHDVSVGQNGHIYTLRDRDNTFDGTPILDGEIVVLSPGGKVQHTYSILDLFRSFMTAKMVRHPVEREEGRPAPFHINTVQALPKGSPLARWGQVLVCVRNLNLVAIVDLEHRRVGWSWGPGKLDWPHNATALANGHIQILDNRAHGHASRVIEVDPKTRRIVWSYSHPYGPHPFWTKVQGSAQRLRNGNVLITEADAGRIFEVTPAGTIVWEYWNPLRAKKQPRNWHHAVYRASRWTAQDLPDRDFRALLARLSAR